MDHCIRSPHPGRLGKPQLWVPYPLRTLQRVGYREATALLNPPQNCHLHHSHPCLLSTIYCLPSASNSLSRVSRNACRVAET